MYPLSINDYFLRYMIFDLMASSWKDVETLHITMTESTLILVMDSGRK